MLAVIVLNHWFLYSRYLMTRVKHKLLLLGCARQTLYVLREGFPCRFRVYPWVSNAIVILCQLTLTSPNVSNQATPKIKSIPLQSEWITISHYVKSLHHYFYAFTNTLARYLMSIFQFNPKFPCRPDCYTQFCHPISRNKITVGPTINEND